MSRSRRILLVLTVLVVLVVGWPYLPIKGLLGSSTQADSFRAQAAALDVQSAQAEAALADQETFGRDMAAALEAVPEGPELAALIETLDEVITEAGLIWNAGASAPTPSPPDPQAGVPGVNAWQMSLEVTGPSVEAVSGLITRLRALPRLVLIPTLNIVVNNEEGPEAVSASLGLVYFSTPEAAAGAATPTPNTVPTTGDVDG